MMVEVTDIKKDCPKCEAVNVRLISFKYELFCVDCYTRELLKIKKRFVQLTKADILAVYNSLKKHDLKTLEIPIDDEEFKKFRKDINQWRFWQ